MILYPAIDLKNGECVRLRQGDMSQATMFNADPADQARTFERQGATWLHLVDLDGAFAGKPMNARAIEAILQATRLRCQLGGGIRDMKTIEAWLDKGIQRIILGTAALKQPELVRAAAKAHPGRIAVGIDSRGGQVAVEGWAETTRMTAGDLARQFEDAGVAAIIFTDIDRDGQMRGVNWETTGLIANRISIPVIASGGLAAMADIEALIDLAPKTRASGGGIGGAILGRALYEGTVDLAKALARVREAGAG